MDKQKLYYKLNIVFILLMLFPCGGVLYFGYKYHFLQDTSIKLLAAVGLLYIFVGYTVLRRLFDSIINISRALSEKVNRDFAAGSVDNSQNELQQIVTSFNAIEQRFRQSSDKLAKKAHEVNVLKELSDLCYVTLDPREILQVTLERALALVGAEIGSILILDKGRERVFLVKAAIGLGDNVKIDDRIDFESSIAKYAVINKIPLIVESGEKERRFGRCSRLHYGDKPFVIMPIKTIKDVIGVLTIARRDENSIFQQEDVEALTPLLSNAAFTYENIRLLSTLETERDNFAAIRKIFKTLNSSLKNGELLRAILNQVGEVIPFDTALVMVRDEKQPELLKVVDLVSNENVDLSVGATFNCRGNLIDRVLQQEAIRIVEADSSPAREELEAIMPGGTGRACLLAPLTLRGKVNGVLALYAGERHNFQETQEIAEYLANIIAFAIEEGKLTTSVAKRNYELEAIKQIGSVLASSTFDSGKVLDYTMDMIRSLMNVEAGTLALVKEKGLDFVASFGLEFSRLQSLKLKLGQGISGAVASHGEGIVENDVGRSIHFYPKFDETTGFATRSALCVPMISQGRIIGVIEVLNKLERDFSNKDKDLLQSIATSVSIALENSRLYKETASMAENERAIRNMFQKFVPKEIVNKIVGAGPDRNIVEEIRTITLLNLDIRGFSDLTTQIGPHKSVALLNHFFSVMGAIVFKHHGMVDKYLGDGFLALFGAPVSSARDADNAVAAALEMQEAIADLNRDFVKNLLDDELRIGLSIYTGEVVLGNIGFEMKMDYTVIGDPVNKVFELQEFTRPVPNSIIIADSTRRAAMSHLKVRELSGNLGEMKLYELQGVA